MVWLQTCLVCFQFPSNQFHWNFLNFKGIRQNSMASKNCTFHRIWFGHRTFFCTIMRMVNRIFPLCPMPSFITPDWSFGNRQAFTNHFAMFEMNKSHQMRIFINNRLRLNISHLTLKNVWWNLVDGLIMDFWWIFPKYRWIMDVNSFFHSLNLKVRPEDKPQTRSYMDGREYKYLELGMDLSAYHA